MYRGKNQTIHIKALIFEHQNLISPSMSINTCLCQSWDVHKDGMEQQTDKLKNKMPAIFGMEVTIRSTNYDDLI